MAIHITRWRPDTCGCVLELEWDDESDPVTRIHTPVKVERCGAHVDLGPQHQDVLDVVLAENQFKNEVNNHLLASIDEAYVIVAPEGHRRYASPPTFSFDNDRNLRVTFTDAPEGCQAAALTALNTREFSRAVEII